MQNRIHAFGQLPPCNIPQMADIPDTVGGLGWSHDDFDGKFGVVAAQAHGFGRIGVFGSNQPDQDAETVFRVIHIGQDQPHLPPDKLAVFVSEQAMSHRIGREYRPPPVNFQHCGQIVFQN